MPLLNEEKLDTNLTLESIAAQKSEVGDYVECEPESSDFSECF